MVNRLFSRGLVALLCTLACLAACEGTAAEELLAPGAKVEKLADGFAFTEGPACDAKGNVYFSDIPNNRIHKWALDGKLTTERENSGGANGVYWLELLKREGQGVLVKNIPARGKREVSVVQQVIEPDLLYPLLRWADVSRYRALPETCLLLAQDPDTRKGIDEALIRDRYPKTYAYLRRFTKLLRLRAAYKRYQENAPFYSMYNVGPYTVAPHKVVWRRMDKQINAAVVEEIEHPMLGLRPVIPQETCVLIAAGSSDEAHYLCGMLNSSVIGFLVTSHSVRGGKGFGTPSMLDFIRLRRFAPHHARHVELTALSREAHQAVRRGDDYREIQRRIDELVGRLWGLTERETGAICREINGDQT